MEVCDGRQEQKKRDSDLDETLKETFPASDVASTNEPDDPAVRPTERKPPRFDFALIYRLAKKVRRARK